MANKLQVKLRKAWYEALENDTFEQGIGALQQDSKLCCLGVACEVADEMGLLISRRVSQINPTRITYNGEALVLPANIREAFGFSHDFINKAVAWNDADRLSFKEIAKRSRNYLRRGKKRTNA